MSATVLEAGEGVLLSFFLQLPASIINTPSITNGKIRIILLFFISIYFNVHILLFNVSVSPHRN
jgi:hypothetical protein